jgi:hypothetical protein
MGSLSAATGQLSLTFYLEAGMHRSGSTLILCPTENHIIPGYRDPGAAVRYAVIVNLELRAGRCGHNQVKFKKFTR